MQHQPLMINHVIPNAVSFKQLAEEYAVTGEPSFRERHAHPFLVLVKQPEIDPAISMRNTLEFYPGKPTSWMLAKDNHLVELKKGKSEDLRPAITLGRSKNNDIVIRSPDISRIHGSFELLANGKVRFTDMGSLNGTMINHQKLKKGESRELQNGDRIIFCRHQFKFVEPEVFFSHLLQYV
jgi:hypothetical protein